MSDKATSDKVVLWRPMYAPSGHDLLQEAGLEVAVIDSPDADDVKAAIGNARALWVRPAERVTAEVMDAAPGLAVISTSGFGTDNIDIPAATPPPSPSTRKLGTMRIRGGRRVFDDLQVRHGIRCVLGSLSE